MLEFVEKSVVEAERAALISADECLKHLRTIPFDDFGEFLISLPRTDYPNISKTLPAMASEEVQQNWTGGSGSSLLRQTNGFVRVITQYYTVITRRSLQFARVLDFGCGYGRMIRSMYYFVNPDFIYGCDPWDQSIERCREASVLGHLAISEYLPEHIPFAGKFDLIYAFSVFTHLSERATKTCINALSRSLAPGGVMVITIRPIEYWNPQTQIDERRLNDMTLRHREKGFAFNPHNLSPIDGDVTYGDTSMSLEYISENFPNLIIEKVERTMDDWSQTIVFLRQKT